MARMKRPLLNTKIEVFEHLRQLRVEMRTSGGPRVKARDIALGIYDNCRFSETLRRLLVIDGLTEMSREIIREERHAHAKAKAIAGDAPEFPGFEEICGACPRNYALPGEDDPSDTVYIDTFDDNFTLLPIGVSYLRQFARGALRNAESLENLHTLCKQLKGIDGETPREILKRHGFDPGD